MAASQPPETPTLSCTDWNIYATFSRAEMLAHLFIYFIDLSQKSLHNYTFQIDASKNITLCERLGRI